MKLHVTAAVLVIFALAGVTVAEDKTKAAEAAAEAWLELLDSGHYAQSWQDFSSMFKAAVGEKEWEQQMRAVRTPLGEMISRKVRSADFATQLPGVPDGQYVVIRYETSFANKKSAIETVTPMLDKDGQWHVSGYFIK